MKKFICISLVFLLIGTLFAFSQNIIQHIQMRCSSLVLDDGQEYSWMVSSVRLAIFDDSTTLIVFTFNNGNTTDYHLTNQRRLSNNQIQSDVVLRSGGQRISGLTGLATESPGILLLSIYDGSISSANLVARMTLRTN